MGFWLAVLWTISAPAPMRAQYLKDLSRQKVSPAHFELNLLSLCSLVIKADGQVSQRELDYVRQYFLSTYGKEKANAIFRTFNEVIKKREISAQKDLYLSQSANTLRGALATPPFFICHCTV